MKLSQIRRVLRFRYSSLVQMALKMALAQITGLDPALLKFQERSLSRFPFDASITPTRLDTLRMVESS